MTRTLTLTALAAIMHVGCVASSGGTSSVRDSRGVEIESDSANVLAKLDELSTAVDAAINTTITASASVESDIAGLSSKVSQTLSQTAGRDANSRSYIGDSWSNRIAIVLLGAIPLLGVPVCFIIYARLKTNPLGRRVLYGRSPPPPPPPPLFDDPLPPPE